MTINDINNSVTAIIKAFERPSSLISLVQSIRNYYPNMPIVIVDDSHNPTNYNWDNYTKYIHTQYDIGLSAGRNLAVQQVDTPYTLLLDDDFIFTNETKIKTFLDILSNSPYEIVAGDVIDHGRETRVFRGKLEKRNNLLYLKDQCDPMKENGYLRYDYVINFFLANTKILKQFPWDPDLKVREHEEFFWRLKENEVKITYTDDVSIDHHPIHSMDHDNDIYFQKRIARFEKYHEIACKKIGVEDFIIDSTTYHGPFKIFKLYRKISSWLLKNKSNNFFIYLLFTIHKRLLPAYQLFYRYWIKS